MASSSALASDGTLVVAAWAPELDGLESAVTRAIGVGLVEASAGSERSLAELRPARAILIGSAGKLPSSSLHTGAVAVVARAYLVLREFEYAPLPMPTRVDGDHPLAASIATHLEAPLVEAVSTLGITRADGEAERLSHGPAELEQLECFAFLSACARHKVPAACIFAVANRVGSTGASEWRQNRVRAEAAARQAVQKLLG